MAWIKTIGQILFKTAVVFCALYVLFMVMFRYETYTQADLYYSEGICVNVSPGGSVHYRSHSTLLLDNGQNLQYTAALKNSFDSQVTNLKGKDLKIGYAKGGGFMGMNVIVTLSCNGQEILSLEQYNQHTRNGYVEKWWLIGGITLLSGVFFATLTTDWGKTKLSVQKKKTAEKKEKRKLSRIALGEEYRRKRQEKQSKRKK